jgi:hypothetical protein
MNEKIASALKDLQEINAVITTLDPAIKEKAFERLFPMIFAPAGRSELLTGNAESEQKDAETAVSVADTSSLEAFFANLNQTRPAENVMAICAWLYATKGDAIITLDEIKGVGDQVGMTLPDRPDMTLAQKKNKKNPCFRKNGKGYSLTVHGKTFLKEQYGARPVKVDTASA